MRAHQVYLQLADLISCDAHVGELSNPGGHGVGDFVSGYQRVNDRSCTFDGRTRVGIEDHRPVVDSDLAHGSECQIISVDVKSFQESFSLQVSSFKLRVATFKFLLALKNCHPERAL
jgi:hypothetical protein